MSIRGDAAVIPELGSSWVMETLRVRSEERDEDGIDDEAGDRGSSGSSTSILPESGAELVPLPRPAERERVLVSGALPVLMFETTFLGDIGISTGCVVDSWGWLEDASPCVSSRWSGISFEAVEIGGLGLGRDFKGLSTGSGACVKPPCDLIKLV